MANSKLITIKEAAELLNVTTLTLRNWDKGGKLTPLRHPINNYRVYKRQDIEDLLSYMEQNTKPVNTRKKKVIRKLEIKHLSE